MRSIFLSGLVFPFLTTMALAQNQHDQHIKMIKARSELIIHRITAVIPLAFSPFLIPQLLSFRWEANGSDSKNANTYAEACMPKDPISKCLSKARKSK